jgi:hypothetical protein
MTITTEKNAYGELKRIYHWDAERRMAVWSTMVPYVTICLATVPVIVVGSWWIVEYIIKNRP